MVGIGKKVLYCSLKLNMFFKVQYQALGCFVETPGVEAIPVIEKRFVELHDNATTRKDAVDKCARSAEALGHRIFAIRAGGLCASSANASLIYETYNVTFELNATTTYNISSVYELTTGTRSKI